MQQSVQAVGDMAHGAYTVVRHPVQTYNAAQKAAQDYKKQFAAELAEAEKSGTTTEFYSQFIGRGGFELLTFVIPASKVTEATKALKAAAALRKAGEGTELLRGTKALSTAARVGEGEVDLSRGARTARTASEALKVVKIEDAEAFKAAAEHPLPNTRYESGTYAWTTDTRGRTIEASGRVELKPGHLDPKLRRAIGKEGVDTDIGFHIIGDRFHGPTNRLNVVPGNGVRLADGLPNLNQGAFKRFENQLAKLAADPKNEVEVRIQPRYNPGNASTRPDGFIAAYRMKGGDWMEREFVNKR